jgi:hypothetical protein
MFPYQQPRSFHGCTVLAYWGEEAGEKEEL